MGIFAKTLIMKYPILLLTLYLSLNGFTQVPSYVPTDSLIAWWPFDGTANDESGNSHNGATFGITYTNDRFNTPNSAVAFSGYDSIIVATSSQFNSTDERSISLWVYNPDLPLTGCEERLLTKSPLRLYFHKFSGAKFQYYNYGVIGGTPQDVFTPSTNFEPADWYHAVVTVSSDNMKIYVNGVLMDSTNYGSAIAPFGDNSMNNLNIGGTNNFVGPCTGFSGKLDDIGFWNRALSQCEVEALYTAQQCLLGVTELNLQSKELVKITDLMGRESKVQPNTTLIYIYSDGTTEKVYQIE